MNWRIYICIGIFCIFLAWICIRFNIIDRFLVDDEKNNGYRNFQSVVWKYDFYQTIHEFVGNSDPLFSYGSFRRIYGESPFPTSYIGKYLLEPDISNSKKRIAILFFQCSSMNEYKDVIISAQKAFDESFIDENLFVFVLSPPPEWGGVYIGILFDSAFREFLLHIKDINKNNKTIKEYIDRIMIDAEFYNNKEIDYFKNILHEKCKTDRSGLR